MAQRPASSSSRSALIAPSPHEQNFKATCPPTIKLRGSCGPGSSSLAWSGQLMQAPPPTGQVVGGQRRRGGRKVKSSWVKAEFERKESQQDGKTTVEYSCACLHCQRTRTLMSDHWAERSAAQEPPAQSWHLQVPVQPLCATGGKAGA